MKIYFAFDTETGGLDENKADVLTFYGACFDEYWKFLGEIDMKLKPDGGRLPLADAGALAVNGIDLHAHLADPTTITYSEAKKKLISFLKPFHKKTGRYNNILPFGQNVPFDIRFTQQYILSKTEWDGLFHYKTRDLGVAIDFLKDAGWVPEDIGNLGSIVEFLQVSKRSAHTAKDDTLMTVDCYKKLLEVMASKKEGGSSQDLISLLEAE